MNQKIKNALFAAQKEASAETQQNSFAYESLVYEKFAKLLVAECIGQLNEIQYESGDEWDRAIRVGIEKIESHFA